MALRVLHADDHPIVRRGCRAILERDGFAVVAEAGDGSEAIALARLHRPDAALLDIGLPIVAGFDVARALAEVTPTTRVLMLTVRGDEATILAALQMGIRGYVAKSHAGRELAAAIRAVLVGGVFVSPDLRRGAVDEYLERGQVAAPLSMQDRLVLEMIADGHTTAAIARMLRVSVKTAETYRARLYAQLHVHDTAGLVRYAVRAGLIHAGWLAVMHAAGAVSA